MATELPNAPPRPKRHISHIKADMEANACSIPKENGEICGKKLKKEMYNWKRHTETVHGLVVDEEGAHRLPFITQTHCLVGLLPPPRGMSPRPPPGPVCSLFYLSF